MSTFQPSPLSYGDSNDAYYAQEMLTTYRQGNDVGDAYGALDPVTAIAEAAGGLFSLGSTVVGAVHQGKQAKLDRAQELKMEKQYRKTLAEEQKLAAIQADGAAASAQVTMAMASWIGGSVLILGILGIGVMSAGKK